MKKTFVNALVGMSVLATICTAAAPVYAADIQVIRDPQDARIEAAINAIDNQNFDGSGTSAEHAKEVIRHFIYEADYAAVGGGGVFPYPNSSGSYYYSISDNKYKSIPISGAKGCMAFANAVASATYGKTQLVSYGSDRYTGESLKSFLMEHAQAGEEIRFDNHHSVSFISCDDNGFYFMSYNGDRNPYILLDYATYGEFVKWFDTNIYLYDSNQSLNSQKQKPAPASTPSKEAVAEANLPSNPAVCTKNGHTYRLVHDTGCSSILSAQLYAAMKYKGHVLSIDSKENKQVALDLMKADGYHDVLCVAKGKPLGVMLDDTGNIRNYSTQDALKNRPFVFIIES